MRKLFRRAVRTAAVSIVIERTARNRHDFLDLERLRDEVPRSFSRCLDSRVECAKTRYQDHRTLRSQVLQQIEPGLVRFEIDVADNRIDRLFLRDAE